MIVRVASNGQIVQFPDGTAEDVIARTLARASAGELARPKQESYDLSSLRAPAPVAPGNIDLHRRPAARNRDGSISTVDSISIGTDQGEVIIPTIDDNGNRLSKDEAVDLYRRTGRHLGTHRNVDEATAAAREIHQEQARFYSDPREFTEARLRATVPAPAPADPRPDNERATRSPEWWQSVTGSPDDKSAAIARERALRAAEEAGPYDMKQLGFSDEGMYYLNPETGERVLKRRRAGYSPEAMDEPYQPLTADERRLRDIGAPYQQPDRPERLEAMAEVRRAAVGGVPGRVAASGAGLLLPLQVGGAVAAGVRDEISDIASDRLPSRAGESFSRGARRGWEESPVTKGAAEIDRRIVEPDRDWLARASAAAGLPPAVSAVLDTGQMIAGEALNPGNYVGIEVLRGAAFADRAGVTAGRTAALETRGGARYLDTGEGIVAREYGSGEAPSELAQAAFARSDDLLPLVERRNAIDDELDALPGPPPFEGSVEGQRIARRMERDPLPLPFLSGTEDPATRARVAAAWDVTSRRHPRLAARVEELSYEPRPWLKSGARTDGRVISGDAITDPGALEHELVHVAQYARGTANGDGVRIPVIGNLRDEAPAYARASGVEIAAVPGEARPLDLRRYTDEEIAWLNQADESPRFAEGEGLTDVRRGAWKRAIAYETTHRVRESPHPIETNHRLTRGPTTRPSFENITVPPPDPLGAIDRTIDDIGRRFRGDVYTPTKNAVRLPSGDIVEPGRGGRIGGDLAPTQTAPVTESLPSGPSQLTPFADPRNLRPRNPGEAGSIRLGPGREPLPPVDPTVPLPEEIVAEQMGWTRPMGPPRATRTASAAAEIPGSIDPLTIRGADGRTMQTNIAAQIDPVHGYFGDPEVAGYIIEKSDEIFQAIGPPQSWDTLEEMALRVGKSKEDFLADATNWNVMPPEVRLRLTYVIKGNEQKIGELQSKLARGEATDIEKADLLRAIDTRGDMIRLGAKSGTAYGRALNSLKMEARLALGDDQLLRQQLYRKYAKQLDAEKPLMDSLARLNPGDPEELQAFLRHVDKPTFREYLQEYWVASILSGPATHERNLIGNTVNMVMDNAVVRPVSAMWDAAAVGRTGSREIFLRETRAAVVGLTRGVRQGLRRGLEVLRRGYDPETMKGKLFPTRSAFARSQNAVVRDVVGPVVTMPLRLLAASDALFKSMNFTAELYAQAARAAAKEGLAGPEFAARTAHLIANPTDAIIDAADRFALKATFNDDASAVGQAIMNLREALPIVGDFILPFVKIADRLMVRGFEYTPVGAMKAVGAARRGANAEAADLAARSSIGSVILAYAASLAMEGRLTAGAPTDEGEKAAFYGANKQAWAARTEDGTWIPYGGLQPVGTPFAVAAAAWKGWAEHDEEPSMEKLGHAAAEIGVYVTDQSYMDALSKFMDAVGGSEQQRGRAFSDLATNTVWGFTPYSGLTRTVARAIDPRVIDADTISKRLAQNVPVISLGMDARLTPWGEDVIPQGGRRRAVLAPGSILLPSREKNDPLDVELGRLGIPLGYVGKSISDKLGADSRGPWKLDGEEWYFYQQTAGRATRKTLETLFASPRYQGMQDAELQREETEKAIGKAREYARIQTVRRHRGLGWK